MVIDFKQSRAAGLRSTEVINRPKNMVIYFKQIRAVGLR